MNRTPSANDVAAATEELHELEKHIGRARRTLGRLESALVQSGADLDQALRALSDLEKMPPDFIEAAGANADMAVDLREVNAQLVVSALAAQVMSERTEETQQRQSEFFKTCVHELRNPLTPISYAAAILSSDITDPDIIVEVKNIIERQVEHISRLLNDLLDLARIEAGKLSLDLCRIDFVAFMEEILATYAPIFSKHQQTLNHKLPNGEIFLSADPIRLAQILSNLLGNATKYTPQGGQINVSLSRTKAGAELRIIDNGIGIAADILPNIFTRYLQDPAASAFNRQGLGIGLAVVQELVVAHGGKIIAHSDGRGRGSEFVLTLPIAEDELADVATHPAISSIENVMPPRGVGGCITGAY